MSAPPTRLGNRELVRLAAADPGEDVRGFLQGLVTNDVVAGPLPCWAALLSPQGKVLFDFLVWADGADLLLDCEAEAASPRLSEGGAPLSELGNDFGRDAETVVNNVDAHFVFIGQHAHFHLAAGIGQCLHRIIDQI